MSTKYSSAIPPTFPTVAAFAMEPTPRTMVQKMTGAIIILMSAINPVPMGARPLAKPGAVSPSTQPIMTAAITERYSMWVGSL